MTNATLIDRVDAFESALRARGRSHRTAKLYAAQIRSHLNWSNTTTGEADDLARWINDTRASGDSASTTRQRLAAARAWLAWQGQDYGPLGDYKAPPLPAPDPRPLPDGMADVARMVSRADDPNVKCAIALGGYAGLRISESLSVTWGNIEGRRLIVRGKGDKQRTVPISSTLAKILDDARPEGVEPSVPICGGLTDSMARKAIVRLADQLGMPDVSTHDLRATWATCLFNSTKDVLMVSKLLGHASITTTQAYLGFDAEAAASAVEALL